MAASILEAFLDGESQADIAKRHGLGVRTVSLYVARGRVNAGISKATERRKRASDSWIRDQIATIMREVGDAGTCTMLGIDDGTLSAVIEDGGTEDFDLDLAIQKAFYAVKAYQLDVTSLDLSTVDRLSRTASTDRLRAMADAAST